MAPNRFPPLQRWRASPWLAHIAPLSAFLLLQGLVDLTATEDLEGMPWWRIHPEHWVYPLQTITALAMLLWWRRQYAFTPLRVRHAAWALALGLVGIAVWIAPEALGWTERTDGFDPWALGGSPVLVASITTVRLIRLVLIAALIEEIFWRGFLQRYLAAPDEDFWEVPLGTFTWSSAALTTVGVVLVHAPSDWPAAAVWGILVATVYLRTKSLSACVLMHAAGNLILGIYVLRTGSWGLW